MVPSSSCALTYLMTEEWLQSALYVCVLVCQCNVFYAMYASVPIREPYSFVFSLKAIGEGCTVWLTSVSYSVLLLQLA